MASVQAMKTTILTSLLIMTIMTVLLQNLTPALGQNTVTLYPVADSYADSKYPNSAYGKVAALYVGNSYDHVQGIWGSERIYIRFDLSGLPKNRVIIQATLHLWQYYAPKSNQTYEAHRVLGDWNETTENWNKQPSCASAKTSEAIAANRTEVAVEWDMTADVKAWYSGEARNYGEMIKVANEEHAQDASSGFWSREYPVDTHEEWRPKLIIILQSTLTTVYAVTVSAASLPNGTASTILIDGQVYASLHGSSPEKITFDRGTTHTITVSRLVSGPPGVRYRCDLNETRVSVAESHVFVYSVEYLVTFSAEPSNLFQTPPTGWYGSNATVTVSRTGPDLINTASGARLVFDAWYLNGRRLAEEPKTVIINGPTTLEGRYGTEYYLNVTSPLGRTEGSGWYAKDTVASFSVDTRTVPAEGFLGLLGMKRSFTQWLGSNNFLGLSTEPQGSLIMKEPTAIEAVWQDDYSSLTLNIAILILVVAILGVGVAVASRKRRRRGTSHHSRLASLRRSKMSMNQER